jgi:hypothetical protein
VVEPTNERAKKVTALAAKLRVLHTELAQEEPELRREQLQDSVKKVASSIPAHERERFYEELLVHFPTWSSEDSATAQERVIVEEVRDPLVLARRLAEARAGMSESQRAQVEEILAASGWIRREQAAGSPAAAAATPGAVAGLALPGAVIEGVRKAVGAASPPNFNPERLAEFFVVSASYMISVENFSTAFARDISIDGKFAAFTVPGVKKDIEKFLSGDPRVAREVLQRGQENNLRLIAAILRAVKRAGEQYAADHLSRFSPQDIENTVPGGVWGSRATKCWEQYCVLMKTVDRASISRRIQDLVKKEIEIWLEQF